MMLFLHGFPETSFSWRYQLEYFKGSFHVVALDMRGYGASDAPLGLDSYSMDKLCLDVCATIKAFGHHTCTLIGHDWGGMVAWHMAANFPNVLDGVVTICSPHPQAYENPKSFTPSQAKKSAYFLLFRSRVIPEIWLTNNRCKKIDELVRGSGAGIINKDKVSAEDVDVYRKSMRRPGRSTATLNYYRHAMSGVESIITKTYV